MGSAISRRRFAATASGTLTGFAALAAGAGAAQYEWKFGFDLPPEHPITVRVAEALTKIRRASNGQLDIKLFPNGALGGPLAMVSQLREGALEMMCQAGGTLDNVVPVSSIENVAFAFPDRKTVFAAMDGDLGNVIKAQVETKGMHVVGKIFEAGFREFTTNSRPIRTIDDLQGLRLRVSPGKLRVDTFRSLGVAVTPIGPNELYVALQTHIVDGQETALITIEASRYYEVQKYCSISHHMWSGYWGLVNLDKWNALTPTLRTVVDKYMSEAAIEERHDNNVQIGSVADKLRRQGLIFNTITPPEIARFRTKLVTSDYYKRWRTEFGTPAWDALEKYAGKLA